MRVHVVCLAGPRIVYDSARSCEVTEISRHDDKAMNARRGRDEQVRWCTSKANCSQISTELKPINQNISGQCQNAVGKYWVRFRPLPIG